MNLESFESFSSAHERIQFYKSNAGTWHEFTKLKNSAELIQSWTDSINDDNVTLQESLKIFSDGVIKESGSSNSDFRHYEQDLLMGHLLETRTESYKEKIAILICLQCPMRDIVGFGHKDRDFETATGNFLDLVFYPFLKGIQLLNVYSFSY